jgi:hypothetical protein
MKAIKIPEKLLHNICNYENKYSTFAPAFSSFNDGSAAKKKT